MKLHGEEREVGVGGKWRYLSLDASRLSIEMGIAGMVGGRISTRDYEFEGHSYVEF